LVARKGAIRQHHFAHQSPIECPGVVETILHRLAKELFREIPSIQLPEYRLRLRHRIDHKPDVEHEQLVMPAQVLQIAEVRIESHEGAIIPDIVLVSRGGRSLFVEITVSHGVDRPKLRQLRKANQAAIEIRLTESDGWLTPEELRSKLANDVRSKSWAFHPRQRNTEEIFYRQARSTARQAREERRTHAAFLRKAVRPPTLTRKVRVGTSPEAVADMLLFDEFSLSFACTHGRAPSLDETVEFWTRLRRERKA
jgi:hypothetical protein